MICRTLPEDQGEEQKGQEKKALRSRLFQNHWGEIANENSSIS